MKKPNSNAVIRAWAAEQGIECSQHGRVPGDIKAAYMAAHGVVAVDSEKRLLTVAEAAKVLGYNSVNPVYKLIAENKIPTVNLPVRGGTRVDQKDLDGFIERMKRSA